MELMNEYMSAVGLGGLSLNELEDIYRIVEKNPDLTQEARYLDGHSYQDRIFELTKYITRRTGIRERGFLDRDGNFVRQEVFPFVESQEKATENGITLERLKSLPGCMARTEIPQLGCVLYSYIQNLYEISDGREFTEQTDALYDGLSLSGLSYTGMILLPKGDANDKELSRMEGHRNRLKNELYNGNDDAYDQLTLTEMQIYTKIDKRARKDSIYGVVETTFMPRGIEDDMYYCIGVIEDMSEDEIGFTGQSIYHLMLSCCGIRFEVTIGKDSLLGEPEIGRRFKGMVWMQSKILV